MQTTIKAQRVDHANALLKVISEHGRQFFLNKTNQSVASLSLDTRGHVWFIDEYRGARVYTHPTTYGNNWRGFSHGGTLRNLVEALRDYISTGQPLDRWQIAPTRSIDDGQDMWGYGRQACIAVREKAFELPLFVSAPTEVQSVEPVAGAAGLGEPSDESDDEAPSP